MTRKLNAFLPGILELEPRDNPSRPLPFPVVFAGAGVGGPPSVKAYAADTGETIFERVAFEQSFTGGVNVGTADFTGDGYPDLVAGAGVGGGPRVRVLDGKTGSPISGSLSDFFAYDPDFRGGVNVAGGDVDGDGVPDMVTAAGVGGGPHVRVFSGATGQPLASFWAFDRDFRGGVNVALADFTGDGRAEVVVGAGAGGGPRVRVLDGLTGLPIAGPLGDFFAGDPASRGGSSVGTDALAGDVDGDGRADLVAGSGVGEKPLVTVYSGASGAVIRSFSPFDGGAGGVRVATAFVNDDALADVVVASGGNDGRVAVYDAATWESMAGPMGGFAPFGGGGGGVSIAASNDPPLTEVYSGEFPLSSPLDGNAHVSLRVTRDGEGAGEKYRWEYTVTNISYGLEDPTYGGQTDAWTNFEVYGSGLSDVYDLRVSRGSPGWIGWQYDSSPLLHGESGSVKFWTPPVPIVDAEASLGTTGAEYYTTADGPVKAPGRGASVSTLFATDLIPVNANNDNFVPIYAADNKTVTNEADRWLSATQKFIPKQRDFAVPGPYQNPDPQLVPVTVTVGSGLPGVVTISALPLPSPSPAGAIQFWEDNKKSSPSRVRRFRRTRPPLRSTQRARTSHLATRT